MSPRILAEYRVVETQAHRLVMKICVIYLLSFNEPCRPSGQERYPFLRYAAEYWHRHVPDFEELDPSDTRLILKLFDSRPSTSSTAFNSIPPNLSSMSNAPTENEVRGNDSFNLWLTLNNPDTRWKPQDGLPTPLYCASFMGLVTITERILSNGANTNVTSGYSGRFGTELAAASYRGHESVVRLLLDKGADIDGSQTDYLEFPLRIASFHGHLSIVQLLLDRGANVNRIARGLWTAATALQAAVSQGHLSVVQLLLSYRAEVDLASPSRSTALEMATARGFEEIVEILLNNGADIEKQGYFGNALQTACYWRHEQLVQLLLEKGANVNAKAGDRGTAKQCALSNNDKGIFMLLDKHVSAARDGGT